MDASAGHVVAVELAVLHAHDHFGMRFFSAGRGAIFTVHGDIEDAAHDQGCSSNALPMRSSVPAKCSQVGTMGNGFSPSKSAGWGVVAC